MGAADLAITVTTMAATQVAQVAAQFAPVPWLSPGVDILCVIIQLCQNVSANR